MIKYLLLGLGVCSALLFGSSKAYAANPVVKGITVSPAIEQIILNPNQNTAGFTVQVTNNTPSQVVLNVSAEDFTTLDQNGGISFYNPTLINTNNPHGLLNFLSIGLSELALTPGQSQTVPISILNANQLAVGGHYSAILFKAAGSTNAHGNKVIINQAVSTLVFLSTYGQGTQTAALTTPVIGSLFTSFPQTINAVFSNTGNTQTTPSGYLQILDSSSRVVSQGQININSSLILPNSKRLFPLPLTQIKKHLWPGVYTLRIYYRHGNQNSYSLYQHRFLYVNGVLVLIIVVVITAIVLLAVRYTLPPTTYSAKRRP